MFRFLIPTILIGLAIGTFLLFTRPLYNDITLLRAQVASYDEALNNSKSLENERDKLTKKYNSINPDNLTKLQKLLPDNVDNIRLILEIEKIASPYGMALKNVKYQAIKKDDTKTTAPVAGGDITAQPNNKDFGVWDLEFSTSGTYNNFLSFLKDLESNLRIVDTASISFSSDMGAGLNPTLSEVYTYDFKIKTYWLKN